MNLDGSIRRLMVTALLAALFAAVAAGTDDAGSSEAPAILIKNLADDDVFRMRKLIRGLDAEVARTLKVGSDETGETPPCEILFRLDSAEVGVINLGGGVKIYLPANPGVWEADAGVISDLTAALIIRRLGAAPDERLMAMIPPWLAAGIGAKVWHRDNRGDIPGVRVYPGAHALVCAGIYPELRDLIAGPPPPPGPAGRLQAELYEIVLDSLRRSCRQFDEPLKKMLAERIANGRSAEEAFDLTFTREVVSKLSDGVPDFYKTENEELSGDAKLQNWFRRELRRRAINTCAPATPAFAEQCFLAASLVDYKILIQDEDGRSIKLERTCPLSELAMRWDEVFDKYRLIHKLEQRFATLRYESPDECVPALSKIIDAISGLANGDTSGYEADITAAAAEFNTALESRRRLEQYLEGFENRNYPPSYRYGYAIRYFNGDDGAEWPRLEKYLDEMEKEYGLK